VKIKIDNDPGIELPLGADMISSFLAEE